MKKVLYFGMAFLCCFLAIDVDATTYYLEGDWSTVNCYELLTDEANGLYEEAASGMKEYSFDYNTGVFSTSGALEESDEITSVYISDSNNLTGYFVNDGKICKKTKTSGIDDTDYLITSHGAIEHGNYNFLVNGEEQLTAKASDTVLVNTTHDEGYVPVIVVKDSNDREITVNDTGEFEMPNSNVLVSVSFEKQVFEISKDTSVNGTFDIISNSEWGNEVLITPNPNEDYVVKSISVYKKGDREVTVPVTDNKFEMPMFDVDVVVTFDKKSFTLSNDEIQNGSVNYESKSKWGEEASISYTPATYYELLSSNVHFYKVSDNTDVTESLNVRVENGLIKFDMPNYDVKLGLDFTKINYNISNNFGNTYGVVAIQDTATYGDKVTVDVSGIKPKYIVTNVIIKKVSDNSDITSLVNYNSTDHSFDMPGYEVEVVVTVDDKIFSISKDVIGEVSGGSFTLSSDTSKVGSLITVNVTPNEGYRLKAIYLVNNSTNETKNITSTKSFEMPVGDVTVKVEFGLLDTPVNMTYVGGEFKLAVGTTEYSKDDVVRIVPGQLVKINYTLSSGYYLQSVSLRDSFYDKDITNILDKATMTFVMPDDVLSLNVHLVFAKIPSVPSKVSTSLYGYDDVKVTWASVTGATGYNVLYRKHGTTTWYYLAKNVKSLSYKKANLTDGISYDFCIRPIYNSFFKTNIETSGKYSSIYTLKKINKPVVKKKSTNYVNVYWTRINGVSGYEISKSTKTSSNKVVKRVGSSYKKYAIKSSRYVKYYYRVRAYKTVDGKRIYGPWSNYYSYKLK